jgi:hypothetical protein
MWKSSTGVLVLAILLFALAGYQWWIQIDQQEEGVVDQNQLTIADGNRYRVISDELDVLDSSLDTIEKAVNKNYDYLNVNVAKLPKEEYTSPDMTWSEDAPQSLSIVLPGGLRGKKGPIGCSGPTGLPGPTGDRGPVGIAGYHV